MIFYVESVEEIILQIISEEDLELKYERDKELSLSSLYYLCVLLTN